MIETVATAETPRIFRVQVTLPNGLRRYRLVKCPFYQRDPQASLFGLDAKLAELTLSGAIVGHSVTVAMTIGPRQRNRLVRWDQALLGMLA